MGLLSRRRQGNGILRRVHAPAITPATPAEIPAVAALMRANERAGVRFVHESARVSQRAHIVECES